MSSDKLPYYPRYPRDYIADTMALTLEEHGAYTLLLDYQWLHESVPIEPEILRKILRISPAKARRLWTKLAGFFPAGPDGQHRNNRMEREREKADTRSRRGKTAAEERWREHRASNAQASPEHMLGDAIPEAEADTEAENSNYGAATAAESRTNPMGTILAAVRKYLYIPDGLPPKDWSDRRDASIAKAKLEQGTLVGEILDAIEGLALLRDRGELDWLKRGHKTTLRALYHTHSGAVPTWTLALDAVHKQQPTRRAKSAPTPLADILGTIKGAA